MDCWVARVVGDSNKTRNNGLKKVEGKTSEIAKILFFFHYRCVVLEVIKISGLRLVAKIDFAK